MISFQGNDRHTASSSDCAAAVLVNLDHFISTMDGKGAHSIQSVGQRLPGLIVVNDVSQKIQRMNLIRRT